MNRPARMEWLVPFARSSELSALDYESAFEPRLPRRTALNRLNRLNRLREAGWIERLGETRSTIYRLSDEGARRLESSRSPLRRPGPTKA